MKKIVIMLLAAMMLFAFTACNPNENAVDGVKTFDELKTEIEAGEKNIALAADIEIAEAIELDVEGLTIEGNGHTMTVAEKPENLGTNYLINVTAADVTISNVNFDVQAEGVYLIEAGNSGATGFTFKDCTVTSETWDATDPLKTSVAIAVNLSTGGTVDNCTFADCYTPVYVNASYVTLKNIKFNSGIVFGADVDAKSIVDLELAKTDAYDKANLDFSNVTGADIQDVRTAYADSGIEVRPTEG